MAEERAAREREEERQRQREKEKAREEERRKEAEARRVEEEKRRQIELRKEEDRRRRAVSNRILFFLWANDKFEIGFHAWIRSRDVEVAVELRLSLLMSQCMHYL